VQRCPIFLAFKQLSSNRGLPRENEVAARPAKAENPRL